MEKCVKLDPKDFQKAKNAQKVFFLKIYKYMYALGK